MNTGRILVAALLVVGAALMVGCKGSKQANAGGSAATSPSTKGGESTDASSVARHPTHHGSDSERVAEYLTHQNALEIMFGQSVEEWAARRISTYDEPLELKIARCLAVKFFRYNKDFDKTAVDIDGIAKVAGTMMSLWGDDCKPKVLEKTSTLAKDLLKVEVMMRAEKHDCAGEPFDTLETRYHKGMTVAAAANLVQLASSVKRNMPASFTAANIAMQERMGEALENDPALLEKLATLPAISDDLRKERERSKELLDRAKQ